MIEVDYKNLKRLCDKKIVRKYADMKERFLLEVKGNPLLYTVYIKDFETFETGLTVIESGKIGKEYFMTKGHRHKKPIEEVYMLIEGKGELLIKEKNKIRKINMKKGKVYFIPGKSGHRLINTGKNRLEVFTIYSKNGGYDYGFEF
ncbi:cupin domain-containing protein [Candidatus Pacearchaeota archaeon]|nr:cupin domain-containing protein [Candidatus Pacearchaeota archaeon]